MQFGLSTHLFVGKKLNTRILQQIEGAGFELLEIFCARQHFDYQNADQIEEVSNWISDHPLRLRSLHAPMFKGFDWGKDGSPAITLAHKEKRYRIDSMDEVRRAIEVAEHIPFEYLILHMGLAEEEYSLGKFDLLFSSIEHLRLFARQRGVSILLENIPNEITLPYRLVEFLEYTKLPDMGFCFDTGHAHMTSGVRQGFQAMRERIRSVHLHDNLGEIDNHLFPFEGSIDWQRTISDFRACGDQFPVLFELRDREDVPKPLEKVRQIIEKFNGVR